MEVTMSNLMTTSVAYQSSLSQPNCCHMTQVFGSQVTVDYLA